MTDSTVLKNELLNRAGSRCEFCGSQTDLECYAVAHRDTATADSCVLLCGLCRTELRTPDALNANHWRCLSDSIWNENRAVQVLGWRVLKCLEEHSWASDLLEQLYLDDDTQQWAAAVSLIDTETTSDDSNDKPTIDSNGAILTSGDSVCIIKDLNVKGTTFTAKRGTIVRNIRLTSNPEHVEGRVNGTVIVLKTCFLKKSSP